VKLSSIKKIENYLSMYAKFFKLSNLFEIFEHAKVFKFMWFTLYLANVKLEKIWTHTQNKMENKHKTRNVFHTHKSKSCIDVKDKISESL